MENWFVINTKPKKEFHVEKLFIAGGIRIYNPKYNDENITKPFFSGYEFVWFDYPAQYQLVKYTRGVNKLIGNRNGPIPIPESIIQQIKAREVNGLIELNKYGEEPDLGDEIEVMTGPWKGFRGLFERQLTDKDRVVILLNCVSYHGQLIIEKKKLKKVL